MPRDSAAADRPASYLVGTAAAFPLFFRDRTKPINQLPFSPSAKFPKSGSSCESRVTEKLQGICSRCESSYSFVLSGLRPVKEAYGDQPRLAHALRGFAANQEIRDRFKPERL